jgi:hypothetical protein
MKEGSEGKKKMERLEEKGFRSEEQKRDKKRGRGSDVTRRKEQKERGGGREES